MIEGLVDSPFSYKDEGKVLKYLSGNVSYDYMDYERYGIAKLVELLKNKYPDIDIDYIISSVDSMNDTNVNMDKYIKLVDNKNLLDELFNICVHNIDLNEKTIDVYKPYIEFKQLVGYGMVASEYLTKYNDILLNNGFSNNEIINENIENEIFTMDYFEEYISKLTYTDIDEEDIYGPFRKYMLMNNDILLPQKLSSKSTMFYKIDKYNEFLRNNGVTEDRIISSEKIEYELNKYASIEDFENINIDISIPIESLFDNFIVVITKNDSNIEFRVKTRNDSKKEINFRATTNYIGENEMHISVRDYIQLYIKNNVDLENINLNEILNYDYLYKFLVDKKEQDEYSNLSSGLLTPFIDLCFENLSQNNTKVVK